MRRNLSWCFLSVLLACLPLAPTATIAGSPTGDGQSDRPFSLFGESPSEVEILKGAPSWVEGTRRTFAGARWDFFPNGTFRFTPAADADVRDDLFPLAGAYTAAGDHLQFQATRRAPLGESASLMEALWGLAGEPKLVALEATVSGLNSEIALIAWPHRRPSITRMGPEV